MRDVLVSDQLAWSIVLVYLVLFVLEWASMSMPLSSAFRHPVFQSGTGAFRSRNVSPYSGTTCTASGINIFYYSGTGLNCLVRHSGMKTLYKFEKGYKLPACPHCKQWTRIHPVRSHCWCRKGRVTSCTSLLLVFVMPECRNAVKISSASAFSPVANCLSPASTFCITVSPVPLVTDKTGIGQLCFYV